MVEVLSPERKTIFLEQRAKYILHLIADRENNFYMQVSNEEFEPDLINEIIRCSVELKEKKLSCTPALKDYSIKGFDVSSTGEAFAFMEWRIGTCVRIAGMENREAPCVTKASYHPGFYVDISPDNKWLVFVAFSQEEDAAFTNDLYLVKIKD